MFCLPQLDIMAQVPGVLVSRPLTVFGKALELLLKHADKGYHRDAVVKSDEFARVMTHQQPDIRSQLNQALADKIASNRQKLSSIFKMIELCGRQNISLCKRLDNATDIENDTSLSENHGNFRALLKFRVDAGVVILSLVNFLLLLLEMLPTHLLSFRIRSLIFFLIRSCKISLVE